MPKLLTAGLTAAGVAAVDGVLDALAGLTWLVILAVLLGTGVGLLPVAGLGLILLVAAVLGTSWYLRTDLRRSVALFDLPVPELSWPVTSRRGWRRPFAQAWLDLRLRGWWRLVLHQLLTTVLGWLVVGILGGFVGGGLAELISVVLPDSAPALPGGQLWWLPDLPALEALLYGAMLVLAGLILLAASYWIHRRLSRELLAPSTTDRVRQELQQTTVQRDRAVRTVEGDRRRIERDLHDGVQPQLVTVGLMLSLAQAKLESDPEAAKALLAEAHAGTKTAIAELRALGRGIHPAILTESGLDAALSALVAQFSVPTKLETRALERCRPEVEAAAYFVVAESLTNAAKHSGATACVVRLERSEQDGGCWLQAEVSDNGQGGAAVLPHGGLAGLQDRLIALGGSLQIRSESRGTTVTAVLPCA